MLILWMVTTGLNLTISYNVSRHTIEYQTVKKPLSRTVNPFEHEEVREHAGHRKWLLKVSFISFLRVFASTEDICEYKVNWV